MYTVSQKNCASIIFCITPGNIGRFKYFLAWNIVKKLDVNDYGFAHLTLILLLHYLVPYPAQSNYKQEVRVLDVLATYMNRSCGY